MKVLVSGASGLIGKNFIRNILKEKHLVSALVRNPESFKMLSQNHVFKWSHESAVPQAALHGVEAVVHLSGENIADRRWTPKQKIKLRESRILGTRNLVQSIAELPAGQRPKVLVSGSAIGFYGYKREGLINENDGPGDDFLAQLCKDWEHEALAAEKLGVRVILLRTGIVLSKIGGALSKMPPVQISDGNDWMSWVHIDDLVEIIKRSISDSSIKGPINCVSPNAVLNKKFVQELAAAKGILTFGSVPKILLKIVLGELSNAVTSSLRVEPSVLMKTDFNFKYPDLKSALNKEFKGSRFSDTYFVKDQFVPLSAEEVFPFFSRAENLEALTPPWLNFGIIKKNDVQIQKNSIIDYRLKIHGVPVKWRTQIVDWKKDEYFIDHQLKGPYSKWHHLHSFHPVEGGCLLSDEVTYRVPFSVLGKFLLGKWISNDVNKIFSYRQEKIQKLADDGALR